MRTKRVERMLQLVQALQSGRSLTADDLALSIGVSRRTIFRDLDVLNRAGIAYSFDRVTKRYSAAQPLMLPPVTLSHSEAMALMLSMRHLENRRVIPDRAAAVSARLKLEGMLPAALRDTLASFEETIEVREEPASDPTSIADMLPLLQRAVEKRRKVKIRYDSYADRKVLDVVLHPYRLTYLHRGWYVVGWCDLFAEVRTLKIERIAMLQALEDPFEPHPSFSLESYFGNAWLMIREDREWHVVIRFCPNVAGNVDEIMWHKTQRTRLVEDGSLLFEVDVDGLREIAWWVLGYGDQAQVLAPTELRQMIKTHAERMLEFYNRATSEPERQ